MHGPTAALAVLAALVFIGLGLEWLFRRTGIPDVLVLLGLGLVASTSFGTAPLSPAKAIKR